MARVPLVQGNSVGLNPMQPTLVRAVDNDGGIGGAAARGLQQAGQAVGQYAQAMDQLQDDLAETEAKEADTALAGVIGDAIDNPETGLRAQQGKNAIDSMDPTLARLRQERTKIGMGLNPRARKLFDQAADVRLNSARSTAFQHVGSEKRTWMDKADTDSAAVALSDAANAFDNPAKAEGFIKTAMLRVDAMAARGGWSDEQILAHKLDLTSGARKDIANRLPADLAENYLKVFKDQLTSDDAAAVENNIRVERNRVAAEQRRQQAEERQGQREERSLRGEQARDLLGMMDKGDLSVPAESVEQLATRVEADGNPVLALRLRTGAQVMTFTSEAKQWRPDQLQGWINSERVRVRQGGKPVDAARIEAGEKLLGDMTEGLKKDPLSWAVRAGTATVAPLDPGNAASVGKRVKTALAVSSTYGIPPKFLTDEEAAVMAGRVAAANPQKKLEIASSIASSFGRYGRNVLGSISGADPVFAHAAALATMSPAGRETAMRIFNGQQAIKEGAVKLPSAPLFEQAGGVGRAMAFTSQARGATIAAAKAIYAADAVARGVPADRVDEDLWESAVNRAAGGTYSQNGERVGGITRYRGSEIVLPPTVSPDEFPTMISRLSDADLKAWGASPRYGNGKPATAADLRGAYLFDAGSGRYFMSIDRAGTQFIQGAKGQHFILDMNWLAPRLRGKGASRRGG